MANRGRRIPSAVLRFQSRAPRTAAAPSIVANDNHYHLSSALTCAPAHETVVPSGNHFRLGCGLRPDPMMTPGARLKTAASDADLSVLDSDHHRRPMSPGMPPAHVLTAAGGLAGGLARPLGGGPGPSAQLADSPLIAFCTAVCTLQKGPLQRCRAAYLSPGRSQPHRALISGSAGLSVAPD